MKQFKQFRESASTNTKKIKINGHTVELRIQKDKVSIYVDGTYFDDAKSEKEAEKEVKAFIKAI